MNVTWSLCFISLSHGLRSTANSHKAFQSNPNYITCQHECHKMPHQTLNNEVTLHIKPDNKERQNACGFSPVCSMWRQFDEKTIKICFCSVRFVYWNRESSYQGKLEEDHKRDRETKRSNVKWQSPQDSYTQTQLLPCPPATVFPKASQGPKKQVVLTVYREIEPVYVCFRICLYCVKPNVSARIAKPEITYIM